MASDAQQAAVVALAELGQSSAQIAANVGLEIGDVASIVAGASFDNPYVPHSGGSGSWVPPGPAQEIDFFDGTNPAQIALELDPNNVNESAVALFPKAPASGVTLSAYGASVHPDGTVDTPAAAYAELQASPGSAEFVLGDFVSNHGAALATTGNDAIADSYYGLLTLSRGAGATAPITTAAIIVGGGLFRVLFDGTILLKNGLGLRSITDGTDPSGADGQWGLGQDGHIYFHAGGVWVLKV